MNHHNIIALAVAVFAIAAPTAVANPIGTDSGVRTSSLAGTVSAPAQDLRNPDNRTVDPARASERYHSAHATTTERPQGLRPPITAAPRQDLRSPDTRDAARTTSLAATTAAHRQDLRSPDTRDAAAGRGTFNVPDATFVSPPQTMPVASGGGTQWVDVGIGAGGVLGLALLALGGTLAIVHRRRSARRMATTD